MDKHLTLNSPLVDTRFLEDLPHRRKPPAWVLSEPITVVGAWEPLFHRRRTGATWVDDEKWYRYEHSEQFVKEILAVGGAILITAYDKNHHVDEEEYALKKQLAAHCRRHGLKLAVYLRADQIYSEVFGDRLQRNDLLARQADGRVPRYGPQEWRKQICFHKPANIEALQRSIHRAITDLGVDMLHLDGFGVGGLETLDACRCDACRRDFTEFLLRRWCHDPKLCKQRFGHTHLEAIEPPGLMMRPSIPVDRVTDPVWQEWIRFRCTWTARFARIVTEYAYELNPRVAILANAALAVRENAALLAGFDVPSAAAGVDIVFNEDGYDARIEAGGRVLQRVRQHKMVRAAGAWLGNYMHNPDLPERHLRQQLAHAASFNQGRVTCLGHSVGCYTDFRLAGGVKQRFTDWLRRHWEHFQELETIADVTVWRESRAMAFAEPLAYATAMRVEQFLIEHRLPFHTAMDGWPLGTRALVLPGLAHLDDTQCMRVVEYVEQGGSVLLTGETSVLDGWGRRREDFGLRAVLPASVKPPLLGFDPHIAGTNDPIEPARAQLAAKDRFLYHRVGQGRVVYVRELVDPASQPSLFHPDQTINLDLDLTNWRVPERADELRRALGWLLHNRPTWTIASERGVIANSYGQIGTDRRYAHVVNLNDRPVANAVLRMEVPPAKTVAAVQVLTPDDAASEKIEWRVSRGRLHATLEQVDVYSILVVELR